MPIPIAIPIIAGTSAALAAAAFLVLKRRLKGKTLAVLGEQKVGKTSLIDFLTMGSIPRKYKADSYARDVTGRRFELKGLELNIPSLTQLSGSTDEYAEWRDVSNEADIVLYLLRVDRLMEDHKPTESRVRRDMKQIGRWLKDVPKKYPLFIVGTYCDLTDPDLTTLPEAQVGDYHNKVRGKPIFREIELLGGGGSKVRFVLGSLKSQDTTEELIYHLFGQIRRKDKKPT